jgi:predicted 3-demethylubiquinone-9 3-methyltransferase (glyoxalase superfamily)
MRSIVHKNQRVVPFLTFHGNAEEVIDFYTTVFPDAKIESIEYFEEGSRGDAGKIMTGTLSLMGQHFMFMDMNAEYECPPFSWTTSFYLDCKDEAEFDIIFNKLSEDGFVMMKEEPFMQFRKVAWVTDKFGVTWQPVLKG